HAALGKPQAAASRIRTSYVAPCLDARMWVLVISGLHRSLGQTSQCQVGMICVSYIAPSGILLHEGRKSAFEPLTTLEEALCDCLFLAGTAYPIFRMDTAYASRMEQELSEFRSMHLWGWAQITLSARSINNWDRHAGAKISMTIFSDSCPNRGNSLGDETGAVKRTKKLGRNKKDSTMKPRDLNER
ncbi:hypothetical protein I7I51_07109, partial [Histoplasma capsulatum]